MDPPAQPPQLYVVATSDCYRPFYGAPGVWERDISYSAYMVYSNASSTKLTGDGSTIIKENLSYISGQQPPASSGGPGQPFFDQISVGNGSNFTETQTFTIIYQGVPYLAQIQSLAGSVTPSNSINANQSSVSINNDPNLGKGGSYPRCDN
jgi:hypothetical protein